MSVIDELSIARKTFDDMTFENDIGTDGYLTGRVGLTLILEHIRNSDLTESEIDNNFIVSSIGGTNIGHVIEFSKHTPAKQVERMLGVLDVGNTSKNNISQLNLLHSLLTFPGFSAQRDSQNSWEPSRGRGNAGRTTPFTS